MDTRKLRDDQADADRLREHLDAYASVISLRRELGQVEEDLSKRITRLVLARHRDHDDPFFRLLADVRNTGRVEVAKT